jgi:Uma2 family endonuclease
MISYVEKILASPDAFEQIAILNEALLEEKKRRHEFREWVSPAVKAEFINGEIVLHSPVKKRHFSVTDLLSRLLSIYASLNKLGRVATEKAMIALTRNDYERYAAAARFGVFLKRKIRYFHRRPNAFPCA